MPLAADTTPAATATIPRPIATGGGRSRREGSDSDEGPVQAGRHRHACTVRCRLRADEHQRERDELKPIGHGLYSCTVMKKGPTVPRVVGHCQIWCTEAGIFKSSDFRMAVGSVETSVGFGSSGGGVNRLVGGLSGLPGRTRGVSPARGRGGSPDAAHRVGLSAGTSSLSRTAGPGRRRGPPAARRRSAGWREADARSVARGARWRWSRWSGRRDCAADCRRAPGSGTRRR